MLFRPSSLFPLQSVNRACASFSSLVQPRGGRMTSSMNPLQSLSLDGHTVLHVPPDTGTVPQRQQTALDALLSELQTFNHPNPDTPPKPVPGPFNNSSEQQPKQQRDNIPGLLGPQRRLPSYPSADSPVRSPIHGMPPPMPRSPVLTDPGPKTLVVMPVAKSLSPTPLQQEQPRKPSPTQQLAVKTIAEVLQKKVPPPPPPRTTSRSPVTSPTTLPGESSFGSVQFCLPLFCTHSITYKDVPSD